MLRSTENLPASSLDLFLIILSIWIRCGLRWVDTEFRDIVGGVWGGFIESKTILYFKIRSVGQFCVKIKGLLYFLKAVSL